MATLLVVRENTVEAKIVDSRDVTDWTLGQINTLEYYLTYEYSSKDPEKLYRDCTIQLLVVEDTEELESENLKYEPYDEPVEMEDEPYDD